MEMQNAQTTFRFPDVEIPETIPEWILALFGDARPFSETDLDDDIRLSSILSK